MKAYLAPHLRKNKEKDNCEPKKEEFPVLVSNKKKNDLSINIEKSFAAITLKKEKKEEKNDNLNEIKAGWSIIKKDNSNIRILNSKQVNETKEKLELIKKLKENNTYFRNFKKMINNWNHFRDTENELRGDLSDYYYYKEEVEVMRKENLMYDEKIHEHMRRMYCNSDSDDNESNLDLIY